MSKELEKIIEEEARNLICETHPRVCELRDANMPQLVRQAVVFIGQNEEPVSAQTALAELERELGGAVQYDESIDGDWDGVDDEEEDARISRHYSDAKEKILNHIYNNFEELLNELYENQDIEPYDIEDSEQEEANNIRQAAYLAWQDDNAGKFTAEKNTDVYVYLKNEKESGIDSDKKKEQLYSRYYDLISTAKSWLSDAEEFSSSFSPSDLSQFEDEAKGYLEAGELDLAESSMDSFSSILSDFIDFVREN